MGHVREHCPLRMRMVRVEEAGAGRVSRPKTNVVGEGHMKIPASDPSVEAVSGNPILSLSDDDAYLSAQGQFEKGDPIHDLVQLSIPRVLEAETNLSNQFEETSLGIVELGHDCVTNRVLPNDSCVGGCESFKGLSQSMDSPPPIFPSSDTVIPNQGISGPKNSIHRHRMNSPRLPFSSYYVGESSDTKDIPYHHQSPGSVDHLSIDISHENDEPVILLDSPTNSVGSDIDSILANPNADLTALTVYKKPPSPTSIKWKVINKYSRGKFKAISLFTDSDDNLMDIPISESLGSGDMSRALRASNPNQVLP